MPKTLFIVLECLFILFHGMVYFALEKVEVASEDLYLGPERKQVTSLWFLLAVEYKDTCFAELLAEIVVLLKEVVFRHVLDC